MNENNYKWYQLPNKKMNYKTFKIVFAFIVITLISVFIIRSSYNSKYIETTYDVSMPTFTSLLNLLSNTPQIDIGFNLIDLSIGDWGLFNFLKDFLNTYFVPALNIIIWFGSMLVNLLNYIFYFIRWAIGF